ncbi:hypothetical protein KEJ26_07135 [Candidatus Bathyarchaeota archaeon]|nr:hypothetical protein [Candidatus Bathyarchaeota archaeon]
MSKRAVKVSVEALKPFEKYSMEVFNDLNEFAMEMCRLGIKHQNPGISKAKSSAELQKVVNMFTRTSQTKN